MKRYRALGEVGVTCGLEIYDFTMDVFTCYKLQYFENHVVHQIVQLQAKHLMACGIINVGVYLFVKRAKLAKHRNETVAKKVNEIMEIQSDAEFVFALLSTAGLQSIALQYEWSKAQELESSDAEAYEAISEEIASWTWGAKLFESVPQTSFQFIVIFIQTSIDAPVMWYQQYSVASSCVLQFLQISSDVTRSHIMAEASPVRSSRDLSRDANEDAGPDHVELFDVEEVANAALNNFCSDGVRPFLVDMLALARFNYDLWIAYLLASSWSRALWAMILVICFAGHMYRHCKMLLRLPTKQKQHLMQNIVIYNRAALVILFSFVSPSAVRLYNMPDPELRRSLSTDMCVNCVSLMFHMCGAAGYYLAINRRVFEVPTGALVIGAVFLGAWWVTVFIQCLLKPSQKRGSTPPGNWGGYACMGSWFVAFGILAVACAKAKHPDAQSFITIDAKLNDVIDAKLLANITGTYEPSGWNQRKPYFVKKGDTFMQDPVLHFQTKVDIELGKPKWIWGHVPTTLFPQIVPYIGHCKWGRSGRQCLQDLYRFASHAFGQDEHIRCTMSHSGEPSSTCLAWSAEVEGSEPPLAAHNWFLRSRHGDYVLTSAAYFNMTCTSSTVAAPESIVFTSHIGFQPFFGTYGRFSEGNVLSWFGTWRGKQVDTSVWLSGRPVYKQTRRFTPMGDEAVPDAGSLFNSASQPTLLANRSVMPTHAPANGSLRRAAAKNPRLVKPYYIYFWQDRWIVAEEFVLTGEPNIVASGGQGVVPFADRMTSIPHVRRPHHAKAYFEACHRACAGCRRVGSAKLGDCIACATLTDDDMCVEQCPEQKRPASCPDGVHERVRAKVCTANIRRVCVPRCACAHGEAANGAGCTDDGAEICATCDNGFHLTDGVCKLKVCTCKNGTAADGQSMPRCSADGAEICATCDNGFHLTDGVCKLKVCTCKNGTAADGQSMPRCSADGAELCVTCDDGFHLSGDECNVCDRKGGTSAAWWSCA